MMVAEKTGWSKHQILNDVSFAELNFMLADSPKLTRKKKTLSTDDELSSFFGVNIEK